MVYTAYINLDTRGNGDIHDITDQAAVIVDQSGFTNGVITIFTPSSTSGITTIEYESGCLRDFIRLFDEIVNPDRDYAHNSRWGDGNGHSHARAALLGPSFTVPVVDKRMTLGTWQQIIFVDFDTRSRHRKLVVQVFGD